MVDTEHPVHGSSQVFVSYSRDDLKFADQLVSSLQFAGLSVSIDRNATTGGEDWEKRLGELIRSADTVIFVLSPASAASKVCAWEVQQAVHYGKRFLPVVCRPLEGATPPSELARLNWILFYDEPKSPGSGFGTGLPQLVSAIKTDLSWLREHTRLLQRAVEWEQSGKSHDLLLSKSAIDHTNGWIARRPEGAPSPTDLHRSFIAESESENKKSELAKEAREREVQRLKAKVDALEKAIAPPASASAKGLERSAAFKDDDGDASVPLMQAIDTSLEFFMGARKDSDRARSNEFPLHPVVFARPFAIGVMPVTVEEWNFAVDNGFKVGRRKSGLGGYPATGVTWDDASAYAKWLSRYTRERYRLPSEAEWEYSCRAGSQSEYCFGDEIDYRAANFNLGYIKGSGIGAPSVKPAGFYKANVLGLHDLHGNVWEWVEDDYHSNYAQAPDDGSAWVDNPRGKYRVLRGGCYASSSWHLRSAHRGRATRTPKEPGKVGFRVAKYL